jgi:hypothetical protein
MPTLHSHTHCQAAPAHAKTKAWQRVCLPHRTTKTYDKQTDENEHRSDNSVYVAIAGGSGKSKVSASKKLCAKRTGNCF